MSGFTHLGDTDIARLGHLHVVRGSFEAPDGARFERELVRNQEVVAMVPLLDDGHTVLLVRQYRGPVDTLLLEIPAGVCDVDGEEPRTTAARELAEEVGRAAGSFELIAGFHPAPGFSDVFVHLYLATELTAVPDDRQGPEEHHMTVEEFDLADLDRAIDDGSLKDAKTLIGLLRTRDLLRNR